MNCSDSYSWLKEMGFSDDELSGIPQKMIHLLDELREELLEEKRKRKASEQKRAFLTAAANAMPNPIFIKDNNLRFMFFNRAYREFFGLAEGENIGKRVQELSYLSPEDRDRYHKEDSELVNSLSVIQYETIYRTANQGEVEALYWSKGFSVPESGLRGVVGEIVDISREKETQRDLARSLRALEILMKDTKDASNTDPLTKLYNRNILAAEIPLVIREVDETMQPVSILMLDIDYFKQINDTYGHPFGDEVLKKLAHLIKQSFRQQDIAIRYGGDEFLLILPGANLSQAKAGAERLRNAVCAQIQLSDGQHATVSIGIAQRKSGEDLMNFISRADEALYLSKRAGRNLTYAED